MYQRFFPDRKPQESRRKGESAGLAPGCIASIRRFSTIRRHARAPTRPSPPSRGFRAPALAALLAGTAVLLSGMIPETPVLNFRLPMFSDEGVALWDLRGSEGRYIDESRVDVFGMVMTIFSETGPARVDARIHSPSATVNLLENRAAGQESITMEGGHYTITGTKWRWEGNENRVSIDEDARVFFYEDITGLFR